MTKNTETTKPAKPETKHLSLTIPADTFAALTDYRHDNRIDRIGPAGLAFIENGLRNTARPDGTPYLAAGVPADVPAN